MGWKRVSLFGFFLWHYASAASLNRPLHLQRRAGSWRVGQGPIQAVITQDDQGVFSYECQTGGMTVITASELGISSSQGGIGPDFNSCTALEQSDDSADYEIPLGRTTRHVSTYRTQSFICKTSNGEDVRLDVRVGGDGCAHRIQIPDGQYTVTGETSKWTFAQNGAAFVMDDPENPSYEGEWEQTDVSTGLSNSRRVMMPYLVDAGDVSSDQWVLLIEGDVDGRWAGSQLTHSSGSLEYAFVLAEGGTIAVNRPVFTPWRIAVVGTLQTLFKSHFDQDNHTPTNITDMTWIKSGNVAWSWLPEPSSPRDFDRQKQYVDLAATEQWPFVLVDEGWDANWIPSLVEYAKSQGVEVLIWYNSNRWNSTFDVASNIADMKRWGVKGAKIDFFLSDVQAVHTQQDYILSQTAEAQLMVNFHGCPPPRGKQRQWPHLMTVEAIRGDELYASAFRQTVIPLTRGLIGGMDFTPSLYTAAGVFFTEEKQRLQSAQCSVGCGLAKAIVYESGWQHPGDKPEIIASYPLAARMYKALPSAWRDSDLLAGSYPGRAIVVGRHSDTLNRYYFAGVFNGGEQTFDLNPTNLPSGRTFTLDIIHDEPGNDSDRTAITRTIQTGVTAGSTISIPVKSNGGFSAIACESTGSYGGCLY